jgi:hypothetical protein
MAAMNVGRILLPIDGNVSQEKEINYFSSILSISEVIDTR